MLPFYLSFDLHKLKAFRHIYRGSYREAYGSEPLTLIKRSHGDT